MSTSLYCTQPALASLAVVTTAGLTFGTMLMSIGLYIYYYFVSHNCGGMKSRESCEGLSKHHSASSGGIADCLWDNGSCEFSDYKTVNCGNFTSADSCGSQSACFFDHNDGQCYHSAGFAPALAGIFAGAAILGGIFSGVVVDQLMKHLSWRKAAIINGCGTLAGGVLCTFGHFYDIFGLTIAGRILHGVMAFGITSIAVMYCRQRNPETANTLSGAPMQFFIAFGQFLVGTYGLVVDVKPSPSGTDEDFNVQARVQGLIVAGTYLPGAMMVLVAAVVHDASSPSSSSTADSTTSSFSARSKEDDQQQQQDGQVVDSSDRSELATASSFLSSNPTLSTKSSRSTLIQPTPSTTAELGGSISSPPAPLTQVDVVFPHEPVTSPKAAWTMASTGGANPQQQKISPPSSATFSPPPQSEPVETELENKEKREEESDQHEQQDNGDENFSNCQIVLFFLKGICVASALQFTGIGAFISFSPSIYGNAGLDGMLGNFLGGIAQIFGGALAFAPGKLGFSGRSTFLAGLALCSLATFLAFLGAFPGIAQGESSTSASTALTMTGMIFYLIVFNATVGPYSWVLMATVFPGKLVQRGMATAVASMAGINLAINVLFPIAVNGISGGPSGNQGYGFGAMFLLFCVVGIIHLIIILCGVDVYKKKQPTGRKSLGSADPVVQP